MDYSREIAPVVIHVSVATFISSIPIVSRVISPVTAVALTVAAYALERMSQDRKDDKWQDEVHHDYKVFNAHTDLLKSCIYATALLFLGLSKGLASIAVAGFAGTLANRIVLGIPPKTDSYFY